MAGKFMRIIKVVIPMLTLILIVSQISGCSIFKSSEMVDMINAGQSITIELSKPSYDVVVKGQQQDDAVWTQLDQLKTFNTGFRQEFDELFNVNIITQNGVNGKSGSLYVDQAGDRDGNTTLEDAFRNKVFVTKYWNDPTVKSGLGKIASDAYTDVESNDPNAIEASLNAYYNLLPDSTNPSSFNATESVSREQFYSLVFKSTEGVKDITVDKTFEDAIGGATADSKFAQEVDQEGFLSVSDKSLDATAYTGSISRAEAIYMIVNANFPDKLAKVTGKEPAFSDTKNAGDLALKAGFKTKDPTTKEIVGKDKWQAYTLAYMLQNPDQGMQEELYKAMVVAKQLGLISGTDSRWDEPISKSEAIQLVVNTELAKNTAYGYLSTVEYGNVNAAKFNVASDGHEVLGVDNKGLSYGSDWTEVPAAQVPADPNKELISGITLQQAKLDIDTQRTSCKANGDSDADTNKLLTQLAQDLGTTLDEIARLPEITESIKPTPSKPSKVEPKTETSKPSNNTANIKSDSGSDSGNYEDLPDWQKATMGAPDGSDLSVPDLTGVPNPFK